MEALTAPDPAGATGSDEPFHPAFDDIPSVTSSKTLAELRTRETPE